MMLHATLKFIAWKIYNPTVVDNNVVFCTEEKTVLVTEKI